jgi:hypothetical protein
MENKLRSIIKLLIVASCVAISLISCEESKKIIKIYFISIYYCLDTKYVELQPLEIQNLTDITYKKEEIKLDDDLQKVNLKLNKLLNFLFSFRI